MKIWVNAPFSEENLELIKKSAPSCKIYCGNESVSGAEIIVGQPGAETDFSSLKLLQSTNAGVEKLLGAVPENVTITNVTGAFGEVISEYILAGLLALCRGLFRYRENQRKRVWQDLRQEFLLCGRNALILGCGDIGSSTAKKLKAFGMKTAGIRRRPFPAEGFDEVYGADSLDSLLPAADVVICCLPHTAQTDKMLGSRQFSLMKHGAILVNVGRGSLTDTAALVESLRQGRLSGAVLDVFEKEPLSEDSPLWDMENVLITPHISGPSFGHYPEVERAIAGICADNISRYLSGRHLRNVIDRSSGYAERGV